MSVKQTLTELELLAMVASMDEADFGKEIEIEIVEECEEDFYDEEGDEDWYESDGQPDEAQEWFDFDPDC